MDRYTVMYACIMHTYIRILQELSIGRRTLYMHTCISRIHTYIYISRIKHAASRMYSTRIRNSSASSTHNNVFRVTLHTYIRILIHITQVTISSTPPGEYIVRVTGIRMLAAPQKYALVVTGATPCKLSTGDARISACISECSTHGQCQAGRCICDANFMGHACEVRMPQMPSRGGQATLRVRANGWAYISWNIQPNQKFEVSAFHFKGESDVAVFVAHGGTPTMANHMWGSTKPLKKETSETFAKDPATPGRCVTVGRVYM